MNISRFVLLGIAAALAMSLSGAPVLADDSGYTQVPMIQPPPPPPPADYSARVSGNVYVAPWAPPAGNPGNHITISPDATATSASVVVTVPTP
jgi:hypothetical protein